MDQLEEVIEVSWWKRIKHALGGVIFAPLFCFVGFAIIRSGEEQHANSTNSLKHVQEHVVEDSVASNNQLFRYSDTIKATGFLSDNSFGVKVKAIKLYRQVLTYQWVEKVTKKSKRSFTGGKTKVKTYNYKLEWVDHLVNSEKFKHKEGHENPIKRKYENKFFQQEGATIGNYRLGNKLYESIVDYEALPLNSETITTNKLIDSTLVSIVSYKQLRPLFKQDISGAGVIEKINVEALYLDDISSPKVGDTKIVYWFIPTDFYSIIGQKNDGKIVTEKNDSLFVRAEMRSHYIHLQHGFFGMIFQGDKSIKEMFTVAHKENNIKHNAMRFIGFVFVVAGVVIFGAPLILLFGWIPVVGAIWEKLAYKVMWFFGTIVGTSIIAYYWWQNNSFSNVTIWDWCFFVIVILMLIFTPKLQVGVSQNGEEVYSDDFG